MRAQGLQHLHQGGGFFAVEDARRRSLHAEKVSRHRHPQTDALGKAPPKAGPRTGSPEFPSLYRGSGEFRAREVPKTGNSGNFGELHQP